MADEFIQDDFIQIPSYLTEGNDNFIYNEISPFATCDGKCMDFCEHYDECCSYERCMSPYEESCQTTCERNCQNCEGVSCQTCQSSQNPATNAVLTISSVGYTSFKATVSGINNQTGDVLHTQFFLDGEFETGFLTTTSTSMDYTYTGLSPGRSYSVKVTIENQRTGQLYKTFTRTVITNEQQLPKLPTPYLDTSKTIKTANSITVTINPQSGVNKHYFRINGGTTIDNGVFATHTFTNLIPNTQYHIEIKVGGNGYQDSDWSGYYATTLPVSLWSWTATERNAFNNKGLVTTITYQRWNEFVDAINTTCNGDWWISANEGATLNYSSTKMTSSDKILTASRFNSIRYNIGARVSTGLNRVYKGDNVLGSYFITLEAKLNEWITNP